METVYTVWSQPQRDCSNKVMQSSLHGGSLPARKEWQAWRKTRWPCVQETFTGCCANNLAESCMADDPDPKALFCSSGRKGEHDALEKLDCTKSLLDAKCKSGHKFQPFVRRIAFCIFNCIAKNFCNERNSEIHADKKRKAAEKSAKLEKMKVSESQRKLQKLTSGGTSVTSKADCGACKFCKDKKKFGGNGTMKKKCVNKWSRWDCYLLMFWHRLSQWNGCLKTPTLPSIIVLINTGWYWQDHTVTGVSASNDFFAVFPPEYTPVGTLTEGMILSLKAFLFRFSNSGKISSGSLRQNSMLFKLTGV